MDYLPIFMNIRDRPCLVVGGGEVAARKVGLLLRAGAQVTVVAPRLSRTLAGRALRREVRHEARDFVPEDLVDRALVIAATDRHEVNRRVSEEARARGIPVNVVDQPELCTFVMPSIIDRSPIQVAVSTGGTSPVLARLLRSRLETLIPSAYGQLARLAESFRAKVKSRIPNGDSRRRFWEHVLQGPVAEMMLAGRESEARRALERELATAGVDPAPQGEVYLVGGGPGDPDLLTFRALRLMQQADVVIYDRLVAPEVLELVRRDAEQIYVGKESDNHVVPQDEINQLLVKLAKQGKRVLRLKGGDPFIFGRGGEEIDTLAQEGIPFQVVPGITAASGCAAYTGIPLTHRDYAHSCVFVTGHLKDEAIDLNWDALVQPHQTVVFYMGVRGVQVLCRELITHGMSAATPVAVVHRGTTRAQRIYIGTLETLPAIVKDEEIRPPSLIIVGEVVRLHEKLDWFQPSTAESAVDTTGSTSTGAGTVSV
ncbi:MAG: uroporphyrinogen-III C-methyltransferase [Chromatiales bacterium 21-64-14]|nr:MAG: uroporphyrinogen-III C-methyltransferase [Chromatiales bacterium 21-64-14]HQU15654.1 siroheme synthase CysG [Gammaproteobacteria bacterium]